VDGDQQGFGGLDGQGSLAWGIRERLGGDCLARSVDDEYEVFGRVA
jgi:hypothetical protein